MTTLRHNPHTDRWSPWHALAVVVAAISHVVIGYFYLVSGLAAPLLAVVVGLAWWAILAAIGMFLAKRRSYLVLVVPVVAALTLIAGLWFGVTVLGWSA